MRQALDDLGLDEERCRALGIRLYKVGVIWPLEPRGRARASPRACRRSWSSRRSAPIIEDQLEDVLYNAPADRRPLVIGKSDERRPHRCCRAKAS